MDNRVLAQICLICALGSALGFGVYSSIWGVGLSLLVAWMFYDKIYGEEAL